MAPLESLSYDGTHRTRSDLAVQERGFDLFFLQHLRFTGRKRLLLQSNSLNSEANSEAVKAYLRQHGYVHTLQCFELETEALSRVGRASTASASRTERRAVASPAAPPPSASAADQPSPSPPSEPRVCGTPGCRLSDGHIGLCTSLRVPAHARGVALCALGQQRRHPDAAEAHHHRLALRRLEGAHDLLLLHDLFARVGERRARARDEERRRRRGLCKSHRPDRIGGGVCRIG